MNCLTSARRIAVPCLALIVCVNAGLGPLAGLEEEAMPDLATLEDQLEQAFQRAVTMEDDEPLWVIQAWSVVFEMASVLEQRRALAAGKDRALPGAFEAAHEQLIQRYEELKPDSGRPELLRLFRQQDPEVKRAAILDLADRYPDDFLIVTQVLQQYGPSDTETSIQFLEKYLRRNPESSRAYNQLAQLNQDNQTRKAAVLARWQEALPGDPDLVVQWLGSSLHRQEPNATEHLLADFFARKGTSKRDLAACENILRVQMSGYVADAEACLARIAGDPEADEPTVTRAVKAVAARSARAGDWSALLAAVESLEPREGASALLAAAQQLEVPVQCGESLQLIRAAQDLLTEDLEAAQSISRALQRCNQQPEFQSTFLSLLDSVPEEETFKVLGPWVHQVQGVWKGDVPDQTRALIERRLEANPQSVPLHRTLDLLYRLDDPQSRRIDLLRRWQKLEDPTSYFDGERALEVANSYLLEDQIGASLDVLEWQLARRFELKVAEALWNVYQTRAEPGSAERFVDELLNDKHESRRSVGYVLRARSALLEGRLEAAVTDYWQALEVEHPNREIGEELLTVVAIHEDGSRSEAVARRLCERPSFSREAALETCALRLLSKIGAPEAAVSLIRSGSENLPDDLESLRTLAYSAQELGDFDTAESAFRRAFELDPKAGNSWTQLGALLEKRGRADELVALLDQSRRQFSPPPLALFRAAGRALTAAGRGHEAVDLLREARANTPDAQGGDWGRSWIDHELRQAYSALGNEVLARRESLPKARLAAGALPDPPRSKAARPEMSAQELLNEAQSLYSGSGGRYDPALAVELYEELASLGDPRADLRLAIIFALGPEFLRRGEEEIRLRYDRSIGAVTERAQAGDAFSQYLLGTALQDGRLGGENPEAARPWLERAAQQGNAWAWHNLGWMAESGAEGSGPDRQGALEAYRRASELGTLQAMASFTRVAMTRPRDVATCQEAIGWLEKAVDSGYLAATSTLGRIWFFGVPDCVPRRPTAALVPLQNAYESEPNQPSLDLGLALLELGEDRATRKRGLDLLTAAAEALDNPFAYEVLALLHVSGVNVTQDVGQAHREMGAAAHLGSDGFPGLRAAAWGGDWEFWPAFIQRIQNRLEANYQSGDPAAAAFLARMANVGLAVGIDGHQALEIARFGAQRGEGLAMRSLYHFYSQGVGTEKDTPKAMEWVRRGAAAGDLFCQMFYGNALIDGESRPRDLAQGVQWLTRAANGGNRWAIGDMAHLHAEGWHGLPVSPEKALPWWRQLAELGDPEALGWLQYHGHT